MENTTQAVKAEDLRLGNYLLPNNPRHGEKYVVVESISFEKINLEFRAYNLSELKPIPITRELLLKLGFEKRDCGIAITDFLRLVFDENKLTFECEDGWYSFDLEHIQFIHQLQNLFFVLTNQELTLKS